MNRNSIYVDVMSSTAVEVEEDDPQVESETRYVTLEFEAKENEHSQVYTGSQSSTRIARN